MVEIWSVLAAAKKSGKLPLLYHAAEWSHGEVIPLCERVRGEHLTQTGEEPEKPTCPACLAAFERHLAWRAAKEG